MTQIQHLDLLNASRANVDSSIARILRAFHAGTMPPDINRTNARNLAINTAALAIADDIANKLPRGAPAQ